VERSWIIDDGAWFGLVLLRADAPGSWIAATQGTEEFSGLITQVPAAFISEAAARDLDPRQPKRLAGEPYIFPWPAGTSMYYGDLGIHANGYQSVVDAWKAVDFMSDGDTDAGHAPNLLLAAASGTVGYRCVDANNAAILLGDFFYTHLTVESSPTVGQEFIQGAELGQMQTGDFTGNCGWATQPDGWFHVHWGFPNTDLQVEGWTLSMSTGDWTDCGLVAEPTDWITAGVISTDPSISGDAGVSGAVLNYDDGGPQTAMAAAGGEYCFEVPAGWTGTVTPALMDYSFEPQSRAYTNVTTDIVDQDYAATSAARPHPADGEAVCTTPLIGVDLTLSDLTRTPAGEFDPSTVELLVDTQDVTNQASVRSASTSPVTRATILYQPPEPLSQRRHSAVFTYPTAGGPVSLEWRFTVQSITCNTSAPLQAAASSGASAAPTAASPQTTTQAPVSGSATPTIDVPSAGAAQDPYRRALLRR
jgi:hypothetical protein